MLGLVGIVGVFISAGERAHSPLSQFISKIPGGQGRRDRRRSVRLRVTMCGLEAGFKEAGEIKYDSLV